MWRESGKEGEEERGEKRKKGGATFFCRDLDTFGHPLLIQPRSC